MAADRYTKPQADRIAKRGIGKWAAKAKLPDVEKLVVDSKHHYYNSSRPILSDADFDDLVDALKRRSPRSKALGIGAKVRDKVRLPLHMGSLDKVKTGQDLARWIARQEAEKYVVSDKLDGVSFLLARYGQGDGYEDARLYTRGDGRNGQDISAWLPHLDMPMPPRHTAVRGELVMSEAKFKQVWAKHAANARNLVSGLVNRKTLADGLEHVDAVAYEFVGSSPMSPQAQLLKLKKLGFRVPAYLVTNDPGFEKLSGRLAKRRSGSRYAVDGLVLAVNEARKRNTSGNPKHMVAFKQNLDSDAKIVDVVDVVWRTTRHGRIAPRVKIRPTQLSGVKVTWISGQNLAYIVKEKIGPGAKVKVVRSGDVIPYIVEVVKPAAHPKTPDHQPGFERWTREGVHAVLPKGTRDAEAEMRSTEFFFSTMGIEGIKYGTITKLANAGYGKLLDIARMPEEEMVEVLGQAAGRRLSQGLDGLYDAGARLDLLMAASGAFPGIGKTRLGQAVESIPRIMKLGGGQLDKALSVLPGWGDLLVDGVVSNMPKFKRFVEDMDIEWHLPEARRGAFAGETVLFTGFRDRGLSVKIERAGGKVAGNWSAKVTLLVTKDGRMDSTKAKSARRAGIPIISRDELVSRL